MQTWIETGTPKIGTILTIDHPTIAEVARIAGFDWIWVDGEHGRFDEVSASLCCALNVGGPKVFVRIPDKSPTTLKRFLDIGGDGIIIPHVNSLDEVNEIGRAALYPPHGERSIGITRAHAYGNKFAEYLESRLYSIIVQIESADGLRNVEEIVSSPLVDAVLIGPYDLSGSLSLLGQVTAPPVVEGIATILACCKRAAKPCGIFAADTEIAKSYALQGFDIIGVGIDATILLNTYKRLIEQVR